MISSLLKKVFGSRNDRLLKQYRKVVKQINDLEPQMKALSDQDLSAKTNAFKTRLQQGEKLNALLPEAFAVVREASQRVLGMRHFDVQLIGGMVLHDGKIAEMRTGEGKTLMSTLAVYLNALTGKGVHVVTVNDYLARRDAENNGRLYQFLGMSVGVVVADQTPEEKAQAYQADVTYGTNNEFGFDYLRDNMVFRAVDRRQRGLHYAIVDEVDSILIDEARTPLIISGRAEDNTALYGRMNQVPALLTRMAEEPKPQAPDPEGDFWVDEKSKQIYLSEAGHEHAEQVLAELGILPEGESLYDPKHITLMHHLMQALRAHHLFFKDQHYVVKEDEVVIVDEFTGRFMMGRRWSDGLHQAIEAKEGVAIQHENQTLASITFQNYFRMYDKLSGMTGTADTEAYEFQDIYGLETVIIPTNLPMQRDDQNDQIFLNDAEKFNAILHDIQDCYERRQPVLVGTTSIENSERLSQLLTQAKLPHDVLNAKQHAREADIIAEAGMPGHITIATNMAGRGTDIVLGGNISKKINAITQNEHLSQEQKAEAIQVEKTQWQARNEQVKSVGGLRIIGTERHESRRIDNQLRGRAGRQGDPGASRFYLSLDDDLMRIFAGGKVRALMEKLGTPGMPIEAKMVSRSIESAQRKVEGRNFDIRKQLLEFDNVTNDQRKVLYGQRNEVLESEQVRDIIDELRVAALTELVRQFVPVESLEEQWDLVTLESILANEWGIVVALSALLASDAEIDDEDILNTVLEASAQSYQQQADSVGDPASWTQFERAILLDRLDACWREHLAALDHLRQGIHLRGYAQKDPKQEYKKEAFELFKHMLSRVRDESVRILLTVKIQSPEQVEEVEADQVARAQAQQSKMQYHHTAELPLEPLAPEQLRGVGRNDPCPCGSGKKYKQCHGKLA